MYRPSDEIRIFDGSEDEEDPEGSRLPLLIVLALLVLAMFAGVVWLAYNYGVVHGRSEPRLLAAEPGPARVAPANPGGTQTPYKGFKIYEQPAPADDEADVAPSPAAPVKKPASEPAPQKSPVAVAPKPVETPAPQKAPVAVAAAPKMAAPAAPKPAPVEPAPARKVAATPPLVATAPPARLAPKPEPVKTAAEPVKAAAPAGGAYVLQIGAYKSQAEADSAWRTYKAKHAALLAGYGPDVQQAELGEKGTWYRLRITGFASKDIASAMCDRLKSDGGSCFLGH